MDLARQVAGTAAITALLLFLVEGLFPTLFPFNAGSLLIAGTVAAIVWFSITIIQRNQ